MIHRIFLWIFSGCFGHQDRIHWVANNGFGAKSNKCALAYSKVQVDCDICRACTIEERGRGVAGSGPWGPENVGVPGEPKRLGRPAMDLNSYNHYDIL
jgi:hypothetical protein